MVSHDVRRYATAFGLVVAAVLVARALDPYISPHVSPPYFLAVMLAAAYSGAGPGLVATALSSLSIAWFDLGLTGSLQLGADDAVRLAVFTTTAVVISSISAARQTAERDLRVALAELERADRAKDEFIASVSHELRTPLASITGWLRILREEGIDAETRALALDSIGQSAHTQVMLVDDLLDVSRIVFGKLELNRQPLFLRDVVAEAVTVIRPSARAKRIAISIDLAAPSAVVSGDQARLKQVVWNFLSNAVKFTNEEGSIVVRLAQQGNEAAIEVEDTGRGIGPELLPHIFDRFRQGSASHREGGLGLGLAIARHIVELHGGAVEARNHTRGCGAVFVARLPLLVETR